MKTALELRAEWLTIEDQDNFLHVQAELEEGIKRAKPVTSEFAGHKNVSLHFNIALKGAHPTWVGVLREHLNELGYGILDESGDEVLHIVL